MGTTQRIIPGVTGEPNWGNLNHAVTSIANTVEKEQQVGAEAEKAIKRAEATPTEANKKAADNVLKQQRVLITRRSNHSISALKNLIRTGGGRAKVVSGKSHSLGRAGIRSSKRLSGFFINVHSGGLAPALKKLGFGPINGKTLKEVIDFLLIYLTDSGSGMDEVAANMATCQVLALLSEDVKTVDELEEKLKSLVELDKLSELLCNYFGFYLFEHLSQRFQEKITQMKGEAVSSETFKIIKDDILSQVKVVNADKAIADIDWKGAEGKKLEENIF